MMKFAGVLPGVTAIKFNFSSVIIGNALTQTVKNTTFFLIGMQLFRDLTESSDWRQGPETKSKENQQKDTQLPSKCE